MKRRVQKIIDKTKRIQNSNIFMIETWFFLVVFILRTLNNVINDFKISSSELVEIFLLIIIFILLFVVIFCYEKSANKLLWYRLKYTLYYFVSVLVYAYICYLVVDNGIITKDTAVIEYLENYIFIILFLSTIVGIILIINLYRKIKTVPNGELITEKYNWILKIHRYIRVPLILLIFTLYTMAMISILASVGDIHNILVAGVLVGLHTLMGSICLYLIYISYIKSVNFQAIVYAMGMDIEVENIFVAPIVYNSSLKNESKRDKIFKIDLHELLPYESKNIQFNILGLDTIVTDEYQNTHKHFYYVYRTRSKERSDLTVLKLKMLHEYQGVTYIDYYDVFIVANNSYSISHSISVLVVKQYSRQVNNNYEFECDVLIKTNDKLFSILKNAVANIVQTNESFTNEIITYLRDSPNVMEQKILLHNDKYGTGKTTLDIAYSQLLNKKPIVVSPWQNNSKHDFMYSVLCEIRRHNPIKPYKMISKKANIYFMVVLFAVMSFWVTHYAIISKTVIQFIKEITHLIDMSDIVFNLTSINFSLYKGYSDLLTHCHSGIVKIITCLFIVVITRIFFKYTIIYWIPFKSDFISYNKKSLVEQIAHDIHEFELLLIIEDVDRISDDEANMIFRDVASIVEEYSTRYWKNSIIGIISLDKNLMKVKDMSSNNQSTNYRESSIQNNILMNNFGKLVHEEIFKEYNLQEALNIYKDQIIKLIIKTKKNVGDLIIVKNIKTNHKVYKIKTMHIKNTLDKYFLCKQSNDSKSKMKNIILCGNSLCECMLYTSASKFATSSAILNDVLSDISKCDFEDYNFRNVKASVHKFYSILTSYNSKYITDLSIWSKYR